MKNINLNAGGVIGALVCGAVAGAIVFSIYGVGARERAPYRLMLLALVGGAFAGNFLWASIFPKK